MELKPRYLSAVLLAALAGTGATTSAALAQDSASPPLSARESMTHLRIEPGFEVKLVAEEPQVIAPVAMSFDERGRIWVVEMAGFMPDANGKGEEVPNGKIAILEDRNADGVIDKRTVVVDGLVLPRALCIGGDGVLVAEPPNLWYFRVAGDKVVEKTLVDAAYAPEGNPEHQPNGLYRALDNWIYSAKSAKRYRLEGARWRIESTHFRGQWGLSQDDDGRLYYNTNSVNLLGDYFTPALGTANSNQPAVAGFSETIVPDARVFPIHSTEGVNRGYIPGVLDERKRLVSFTAAGAPLIYRGGAFGAGFELNAFVTEPAGNLVKRNVLATEGNLTNGRLAYPDHEFLASTDERFRPVNLNDGPDGALYLVDMYRGVIQHSTYLTSYLKDQIASRKLDQPLSQGRIYRIVPKDRPLRRTPISRNPARLVELLRSENGWVRDKAQQVLVDRQIVAAVPALKKVLRQKTDARWAVHALWSLEGLHRLAADDVLAGLQHPQWPVRRQALAVLPTIISSVSYAQYLPILNAVADRRDELAAPYVANLVRAVRAFDASAADRLTQKLLAAFPADPFVADELIAGSKDQEEAFLARLGEWAAGGNVIIRDHLQQAIAVKNKEHSAADPEVLASKYPGGAVLFQSFCQVCHGPQGAGVSGLGPPLNESEWVTGDKDRVLAIVLFGLTGPIEVAGHLYLPPAVSGEMPGIGGNPDFTDPDIAQLLSLIRGSWNNRADPVSAEDVARVREKWQGRTGSFTTEELRR